MMGERSKTILSWVAGLLLLAAVAVLYVLYHRRNAHVFAPVLDLCRLWARILLRPMPGG